MLRGALAFNITRVGLKASVRQSSIITGVMLTISVSNPSSSQSTHCSGTSCVDYYEVPECSTIIGWKWATAGTVQKEVDQEGHFPRKVSRHAVSYSN